MNNREQRTWLCEAGDLGFKASSPFVLVSWVKEDSLNLHEAMIFSCNENGKVVDYRDLDLLKNLTPETSLSNLCERNNLVVLAELSNGKAPKG